MKKKAQAGARMKAAKAEAVRKIDSAKAADRAKKLPLGSKPAGRYDLEKNPGEGGKNFGKSDAGYMKPTMGGAKNGKKVKKAMHGTQVMKPNASGGPSIKKCRGGC
jgi:hypothetical protein